MAAYHWILTLQWHDPAGKHTTTLDGVTDPGRSGTRQDVYRDAYRWATERLEITRYDPAVLVFNAALNEL